MSATSTVYESLPGLSVPVSDAMKELASMWSPVDESGKRHESEYRASRMNLIVHIGFEASVDEAKELFQNFISFSHRYPCRMVVLCPQPESWDSEANMSCKIFSECVFGENSGGMNCCEVLILGYTLNNRRFLENQVSIFLEADLPTYYWPTRFGSPQLLSDYKSFFKQAERIIFDSSREAFQVEELDVPDREKIHDLSFSRLLPIRQSIGQFLSAFEVEKIVDGLKTVKLTTCSDFKCEGQALKKWLSYSLENCFEDSEQAKDRVEIVQECSDEEGSIQVIQFEYTNSNYVTFTIDLGKGEARVEAELGNGHQEMVTGVRLLDPETALAEALFFS